MRRSMSNFWVGLREAWGLAKPYFWSEEKWAARGLLGAVIALNLGLVALNVDYTYWQKYFFNSLQSKNFADFLRLSVSYDRVNQFPYIVPGFLEYLVVLVVVNVYAYYLQQMLQINWRQWLTRNFVAKWLADRAYYNISLSPSQTAGIDNPDQRIADDLNDFATNSLNLGLNFMNNLVNLLSFIFVLYEISGAFTIFGITIPGYMLWLAIIYSIIGTFLTQMIGRKLIRLSFNQQKVEANFRFSLVRVRENPEAIALYGGEEDEIRSLRQRFADVRDNWWAIMRRTKALNFFNYTFGTIAGNFAFFAAAPRVFSGLIQIGDLLQISSVFSQVQGAFSWFVNVYTDLVSLRATVARLHGFQEAVAAARIASQAGPGVSESGASLVLNNLTLSLPDGRKLVNNASLTLPPGAPIILSGPSGAGKSTLFRAIAGIWPFGTGEITRPQGSALFLPQKPYFPLGTLKRTVVYPALEDSVTDETVLAALEAVELGGLARRLHEVETWGQVLSGGEQQRLAIARALIARPDWLFLDEATAACDPGLAARLHKVLQNNLPTTTVVAITHRDAEAPGGRKLTLTPQALQTADE